MIGGTMPITTTPPHSAVLLYDGECVFCRRSRDRLQWLLRDDGLGYLSFRGPGVLDRFPGVTEHACELGLQLITTDGTVYSNAEAAVRSLLRRPWFAAAWLYYLPGLRQIIDATYRWVAVHRFGISGRSSECKDDVCVIPRVPPAP